MHVGQENPTLSTTQLFRLNIRICNFSQANAHLLEIASRPDHACRIVITPNVDHLIKLDSDPDLDAKLS